MGRPSNSPPPESAHNHPTSYSALWERHCERGRPVLIILRDHAPTLPPDRVDASPRESASVQYCYLFVLSNERSVSVNSFICKRLHSIWAFWRSIRRILCFGQRSFRCSIADPVIGISFTIRNSCSQYSHVPGPCLSCNWSAPNTAVCRPQ